MVATAEAACVCPYNASGSQCELFFQYPIYLEDYSAGEDIADSPVGPPDDDDIRYTTSSGQIHITYVFQLPVYLSHYIIWAGNNVTIPAVSQVWVRANATTSWYVVWDQSQGPTILCQPNDMVQYLRVEFSLPPCVNSICTRVVIDTLQLFGS